MHGRYSVLYRIRRYEVSPIDASTDRDLRAVHKKICRPRNLSPIGLFEGAKLTFVIMLIQKGGGFRPCEALATPYTAPNV